jgi:hypothetical protein
MFHLAGMRRLTRQEIETIIAVKLATAPPLVRTRLRSRLTTDKDWARKELAKSIAAQLDNNSSMVIVVTALAHYDSYSVPGKWDVDEPAPC